MTDLAPVRKLITVEETKFNFAVAESAQQKIGGSTNFILTYMYNTMVFRLDGPYPSVPAPQLSVDGYYIVPPTFTLSIFAVSMYNIVAGTSGTTELDLKIATTPGGSFTSIFSTTPKITSAAGNGVWIQTGQTVSGCTAPVLTSTPLTFNSNSALRLDKISVQAGAQNTGLIVYFLPI